MGMLALLLILVTLSSAHHCPLKEGTNPDAFVDDPQVRDHAHVATSILSHFLLLVLFSIFFVFFLFFFHFFFKERDVSASPGICPMFPNKTCCSSLGFTQLSTDNHDMFRSVQASMTTIPPSCRTALRKLFCGVCSPDQDYIFTLQPFEIDMLLCPAFADSIFSDCGLGVVNGSSVSSKFASAAEFLHYILADAVHISVRQRPDCYNPLVRPCVMNDYIGVYGDCEDGLRSAFFSKSPLAECQGGVTSPFPVHGLPCDIACLSGSYLPVGGRVCQTCPEGTFSIGGGVHVEHAWKDWPHGVSAANYCLDRRSGAEVRDPTKCFHWILNDTVLRSGLIENNIITVVDLSFELVRAGHVSFRWQVDAELCSYVECDGFYAELDGVRVVPFTSVALWTLSRFSLEKGQHVLTLAYSKDISDKRGADMAMIDALEINGLFFADSVCSSCPPGSVSNVGSRYCTVCPRDTFSLGSVCQPCQPSEYAHFGSGSCSIRQLCTESDYEFLFTECDNSGKMNKVASWITPKTCGNGGVELPATVSNIPCFDCPPGFMRRPGSGDCVGCPDGHHLSGQTCVACTAGTMAAKLFEVSRWDEWPDWVHHSTGRPLTATLQHGCRGDGCSDEWRLMHDHIDSGPGHGDFAEPWLNFTVDLEASPSFFNFNISFANCIGDCSALVQVVRLADGKLIDSETFYYWTPHRGMRTFEPGFHSFLLTFEAGSQLIGMLQVRNLHVYGARDGSARECRPCRNGTASGDLQDFCRQCPPGTFSEHGQPWPCRPCGSNEVSSVSGSAKCVACGRGTQPNDAHTECETTCLFQGDEPGLVFNLQPLHNAEQMYGPVYDPKQNEYYLSVCDHVPSSKSPCVDPEGARINSMMCQVTYMGVGVSVGDEIAFVPLPPPHQREGFNLTFTGGKPCSDGVVRSGTIAFVCDPDAGHGYPAVPHGHAEVERSKCVYEVVWSSKHACPLCSEADYLEVVSGCVNGQQTVSYVWREQPKRCVDGVGLPPSRQITCQTSTTSCDPGQFSPSNGLCTSAPPGSFSIGNGDVVVVDLAVPASFDNSCVGSSCSVWSAERGGVLKSGLQSSTLRTFRTLVKEGTVSFQYKYNGGPDAAFRVIVDTVVVESKVGDNFMVNYRDVAIPVSKGQHTFEWQFVGGSVASSSDRGSHVLLKNVQFFNSQLAPSSPIPCPGGFAQPNAGQTFCNTCGMNTWSASASWTCIPCPAERYSLPGSRTCEGRSPCAANSDFEQYFTPCKNLERVAYWVPLAPVRCFDTGSNVTSLPANTTVACSLYDCPLGLRMNNGNCVACPRGEFASERDCVRPSRGRAAVPILAYFDGFQAPSFGAGWSTFCNGLCGSGGWRARSHFMDSGFHGDNEVDSVVSLTQIFVQDGTIEFKVHLLLSCFSFLRCFFLIFLPTIFVVWR
jgi:hypothetical protein